MNLHVTRTTHFLLACTLHSCLYLLLQLQGSDKSINLPCYGILFSQCSYLPSLLLLLLFGFLISSFAHLNIKFFPQNFHQLRRALFYFPFLSPLSLLPLLSHLLLCGHIYCITINIRFKLAPELGFWPTWRMFNFRHCAYASCAWRAST